MLAVAFGLLFTRPCRFSDSYVLHLLLLRLALVCAIGPAVARPVSAARAPLPFYLQASSRPTSPPPQAPARPRALHPECRRTTRRCRRRGPAPACPSWSRATPSPVFARSCAAGRESARRSSRSSVPAWQRRLFGFSGSRGRSPRSAPEWRSHGRDLRGGSASDTNPRRRQDVCPAE